MDIWTDIRRRVLVQGESLRSIPRRYGYHFQTSKRILAHEAPPGYRPRQPRGVRKIDPFVPLIRATAAWGCPWS